MNVDEALRSMSSTKPPREAMQWALDNWDEASPRFISKLRALARHGSEKEPDILAMARVVLLCAEKADARAFAPVCDLIATDEAVGETVIEAENTASVLVSLCDGDVEPLKRAIESDRGDPFQRGGALDALAYLVRARGVLTDDEMRGYLARLRETMPPREQDYVWAAWASAIGRLGYEPMRAEVGRLFASGLVHPEDLELPGFYELLQLSRRDADGLAAFREDGIGPAGSAIAMAEAAEELHEEAARGFGEEGGSLAFQEPYVNPRREIGRNDPCFCGSGKKYKKCCLTA